MGQYTSLGGTQVGHMSIFQRFYEIKYLLPQKHGIQKSLTESETM